LFGSFVSFQSRGTHFYRCLQAFRQVNFQDDAAQRCTPGRPSLVSLDNDSQVDDDDDSDDNIDDNAESDDEEENDNVDDDRSLSVTSSVDHGSIVRSDAVTACVDATATPVWHRMLHILNKVRRLQKS